jgi:hypothetical protein
MQTEPTRAEALLSSAAGWLATFEQYDVNYLALDPDQDRELIQLLQTRPEWTLDFRDRQGVLFVRSDALQGPGAMTAPLQDADRRGGVLPPVNARPHTQPPAR